MRTSLSVIKADIGSLAGHTKPSSELLSAIQSHLQKKGKDLISDFRVFYTGDDVAILMAHQRGKLDSRVHKLAWDAFLTGTAVAKKQGLYGAGQDLLSEAFSGNVKGMGPAVAELEFEERPAEPFILFAADKTSPGAYSLPLYLAFASPFHNSGLIISSEMRKGFKFTILDANYTKADRRIDLLAPEDLYDIAVLLRDTNRFLVESIYSRHTGEQAVAVSTTRLHNIAGKYTGKDDPVCLVRVQKDFPATGEVLSPYSICPYVPGFMRGSHNGPLMPVKVNSAISYFDGPPVVSAVGLCVQNGKFTESVDLFDHPAWDRIREKATDKALAIREQGFFGAAMLGMDELEYTGVAERLKVLNKKFKISQ